MKLKCIKSYYDVELNKNVIVGDILEDIKEDRAKKLVDAKKCRVIKSEVKTTKKLDVIEDHKGKVENNKRTKNKK